MGLIWAIDQRYMLLSSSRHVGSLFLYLSHSVYTPIRFTAFKTERNENHWISMTKLATQGLVS